MMRYFDETMLMALIRESLANTNKPMIINVSASVGQYIAHVDHFYQYRHFVEGEEMVDTMPPEALQSPEAREALAKLTEAKMLDGEYQPTGISLAEQALLARAVSERLKIKDVWQVFGKLWNIPSESLRAYYNRALEQRKSLDFQDRLKEVLG
ncbi:MAG: hypothetical protein IJV44_06870 [Prevotella sp.]|nr:hypothetical protein [Prevotella sp.]